VRVTGTSHFVYPFREDELSALRELTVPVQCRSLLGALNVWRLFGQQRQISPYSLDALPGQFSLGVILWIVSPEYLSC